MAEGAQRTACLALGSTASVHIDPSAEMTDEELAAELRRLRVDSSEPAVASGVCLPKTILLSVVELADFVGW